MTLCEHCGRQIPDTFDWCECQAMVMLDESLLLRKARLIDEDYRPVASVTVSSPPPWWPAVIKYGARYFMHYVQTQADTIEGRKAADQEQTYREIQVYDATLASV